MLDIIGSLFIIQYKDFTNCVFQVFHIVIVECVSYWILSFSYYLSM